MPDPVIVLAEKFRAAVLARDVAAMRRLIKAYATLTAGLAGRIEALVLAIGQLDAPTPAQVRRLGQYARLLEDATIQLVNYRGYAQVEMSVAARRAMEAALRDSPKLIALAAGANPAIVARIQRMPTAAVETLLAFLHPEGALYKRLEMLPVSTVSGLAETIVEGVALGRNPAVIARSINKAFGMGLTDSMRMMRTVQLYSYREASRANYMANADVVRGWTWYARLGNPTTCMSCISMHGSEHPVEEPLNDHYNGFCLMLPLVGDRPNPIEESGQAWFEGQDEATQRAYMGQAKHDAWQDGAFGFNDLSGIYESDVYGPMRVEQSLRSLTGG